jgi:8-oxo-dGTP pyrophosphatase MutT (NUDIX family)
MEIAEPRPAVRIICLDLRSRVLLLRWRDPYDGDLLWEPPGGGIEPGETELEAARRELVEETGLDPAIVVGPPMRVYRDMKWDGRRHVGEETFFFARLAAEAPALSRVGLLADEQANLMEAAWLGPADVGSLIDPLEPPTLPAIIAAFDPSGPWAGETPPDVA